MKKIEGSVTFEEHVGEHGGRTIATVEFPAIDFRFYVAASSLGELRRALEEMLHRSEQVEAIWRRTKILDWPAMEAACKRGR